MAIALVQHRAGRFSQAEQIYRQILAVDCNHADSLHLLGMIAFQAGNPTAAVRMIRQAIAINKTQAAYHSNLGTVLQSQGRLDEAATCYERALALQPDSPEIHTNLGKSSTRRTKWTRPLLLISVHWPSSQTCPKLTTTWVWLNCSKEISPPAGLTSNGAGELRITTPKCGPIRNRCGLAKNWDQGEC